MSAQFDRHGRLAPILATRKPAAAPQPEAGRWRERATPNLDRFADVFALFVKGPRSTADLRGAIEPCGSDTPYIYIQVLRRAGLLYIAERRRKVSESGRRCGGFVSVYALQPYPYLLPDVPMPARGAP